MIFSSIFFLYLFLPVTLVAYYLAGTKFRNFILLIASLIFYAWGEVGYVFLMLFPITISWMFGLRENSKATPKSCKFWLTVGIIVNLLPLAFYRLR